MTHSTETPPETVVAVVERQRAFFATGRTKDVDFRLQQLDALEQVIRRNEQAILAALKADLNKAPMEAFSSEVGIVLQEIRHIRKHLRGWARPKRVPITWVQFPSTAWVYSEPYGVALIIGPWNYPFQLIVTPLVGALAAGNCAVLKPSEVSPATSALLGRLAAETFDPAMVAVIQGGMGTAQALLAEKFDTIFYTGGTAVGRIVMQAAARHLTPVTLELGGKSPAIVDADADLKITARRIAWGKFINAGQTCISPDYVLVDRRAKADLIQHMRQSIREFYGDNPRLSPDYSRIISARHFERLCELMRDGTIVAGGQVEAAERYIAPTLVDHPNLDGRLMQEEIFGPILPVIEYTTLDEAIAFVNARPKPLALYFFSRHKQQQERILRETSSGGGCINDVILHYGSPGLPFGGVGESGIGHYRGRYSFETFSHQKSFIRKGFRFDIPQRYAPFKDRLRLLRKLI